MSEAKSPKGFEDESSDEPIPYRLARPGDEPPTGGGAREFIEDVFGAIEHEFLLFFGQRWTPEVQALYQEALEHTRKVADAVDERCSDAVHVDRKGRVISNYRGPRG